MVKLSFASVLKTERFAPGNPKAMCRWWPWQRGPGLKSYFTVVLLLLQLGYSQLKCSSSVKTDAKSERPFCCVGGWPVWLYVHENRWNSLYYSTHAYL